jgi:hypothetical protein
MHTQNLPFLVWPVQKDVVWPNELPGLECLDADAYDFAIINGIGIGIFDFEGCDAGTYPVKTFLIMRKLLLRIFEDDLMQWVVFCCCCGFARWCPKALED